jgi:hypothetical protein
MWLDALRKHDHGSYSADINFLVAVMRYVTRAETASPEESARFARQLIAAHRLSIVHLPMGSNPKETEYLDSRVANVPKKIYTRVRDRLEHGDVTKDLFDEAFTFVLAEIEVFHENLPAYMHS